MYVCIDTRTTTDKYVLYIYRCGRIFFKWSG
jgi:hypothetical protein